MNNNEILKTVNPIYFSAKACLALLAKTGDSDIVNFYNSIDREGIPDLDNDSVTKTRTISLEARHIFWKSIAEETNCPNIVDLPCGYLPSCLTAARLKKNYYGLDLPIVIDEISRVADKFLNESEKSFVHYHGVDATNYSSMRNALKDVTGKICIIMDGLLGYFNIYDLKIVCENIHRLLSEFGGCWYISEAQFIELMAITYAELGGDKEEMVKMNKSGSGQIADSDNSEYLFIGGTLEERRRFMEDCGFSVKSFPYNEKLKIIPSLKDNPALMKKFLSAYGEIEGWVLTADSTDSTANKNSDVPFAQEFSLKDKVLSIRISGRLDTITAPELLQKYEEQRSTNKFTEIHIDAKKLDYISYAGLRVFKIMCESLEDVNLFKIINADGEVKNILLENGYLCQ